MPLVSLSKGSLTLFPLALFKGGRAKELKI